MRRALSLGSGRQSSHIEAFSGALHAITLLSATYRSILRGQGGFPQIPAFPCRARILAGRVHSAREASTRHRGMV